MIFESSCESRTQGRHHGPPEKSLALLGERAETRRSEPWLRVACLSQWHEEDSAAFSGNEGVGQSGNRLVLIPAGLRTTMVSPEFCGSVRLDVRKIRTVLETISFLAFAHGGPLGSKGKSVL